MPPRIGTLASAGMPSKFTDGAAISGLTPALALEDWTAASPAKPRPAAAGPRSGRSSVPAALVAAGRLGASRQPARDWAWRTRSTMLSSASGENGLVK
jgi:hypothetical protein